MLGYEVDLKNIPQSKKLIVLLDQSLIPVPQYITMPRKICILQ